MKYAHPNCLDQSVIESQTINAFKSGLNRIRQESIGVLVRQAVRPHLSSLWGSAWKPQITTDNRRSQQITADHHRSI